PGAIPAQPRERPRHRPTARARDLRRRATSGRTPRTRGRRRALGRLRRRHDAPLDPLRRDLRSPRLARAVARRPRVRRRLAPWAGWLRPARVARAPHGMAPLARAAERSRVADGT